MFDTCKRFTQVMPNRTVSEQTMSKVAKRGDYLWWTAIPTRWADCDAYGHVNNVIYYSLFDTAVTLMLYQRGVLDQTEPAIGLCVESACTYHKPLSFPGSVDAGVRIGRIGGSSLRYEVGLFAAGRDAPAATGHFVHVFVDRVLRRPVTIEERHRIALADLTAG